MKAEGDRASGPVVLLVGRKLPDNENLGLEYLLASLRRAGFRAEMHVLNAWPDMERIARRAVAGDVGLVGLSLPDGNTAYLPLGLGDLLRRRGFAGHITCGGGFATLARRWLLDRYEWLDSVVRFAGERPVVDLAAALAGDGDVRAVSGLTTREGDGAPAPVADPAPMDLRPERAGLPEMLGAPMAHIAATRGCPGRCAYCGPAALQTLERSEGLRAGLAVDELNRIGVGGIRRRNLDDLCDEMADLWHERGVRYFYFVDEHIVPSREREALDLLRRWKAGLDRRRVGRFGIGLMIRADLMTPEVARAFVDVGLVRAFVGVELASPEELRRFGRSSGVAQGLDAIETLEDLGVATVANLLLVHPYSTPATVGHGIDFLAGMRRGVFEATQMMVYHGTRLHERVAVEGRLVGNPLRYGYAFDDPALDRFAQIFARLRGEAFGDYSLAFRAHDTWLAMALARRLQPDLPLDDLRERCAGITRAVNALRVESLREALAMALAGGGFVECSDLIRATHARAMDQRRVIETLAAFVESRLSRNARVHSPLRTAAASALTFCLAGSAAACYQSSTAASDASMPEARDDAADADALGCPDPDIVAAENEVRSIVAGLGIAPPGCLSVRIYFSSGRTWVDRWYGSAWVGYCEADWVEVDRRISAALEGHDWSCIEGRMVEIMGGEDDDFQRMNTAIDEACPEYWDEIHGGSGIRIVVGDDGAVVDVLSEYPDYPRPEVLDCVREALRGLRFPCLTGRQVCPDWVIIE